MDNENTELEQTIMQIISYSGDAKSSAMEAIYKAKEGNFDEAQEKLDSAQKSLTEAHNFQTKLLTQESSGEKVDMSLLLVHAQDHLMTSITFNDIAVEMVDLYKRISE